MKPSKIAIIGAQMDLGAGRRGVDMGPSALRLAGLDKRIASLGFEIEDCGNISVGEPESVPVGPHGARYLNEIAQVCEQLAQHVQRAAARGQMPLVLGGDHSIAAGTVAGVAAHHRSQGNKIGLIWIDAHADMNTPEISPTGNVHGMPLACCIGLGPPELTHLLGYAPKVEARNVAIIGLRDIDEHEKPGVKSTGVHPFTMRSIDEMGMRAVIRRAIEIASDGTSGFHLSFDMDAVDPKEAPGVGTPVRGGLTYREAHLALELICDSGGMLSMEVVEVNPVLDEANRTAVLGVELVMSALGKRIL